MSAGSGAFALIPARGGSKGIRLKNLARIAGKTLLQYAVDAARVSGVVERIIVSSDSDPILDAARALGVESLRRPADLATDSATADGVVAHFIDALDLQQHGATPVIYLQPTSPLRTGADVAAATRIWQETNARCVISVFEPAHHPAKSFRMDEGGMLTGMYGSDAPFTPRQQLPRAFLPNGAIYVFSVEAFLAKGRIPREQLAPFVMQPRHSIDVDTLDDLAHAESYLRGD